MTRVDDLIRLLDDEVRQSVPPGAMALVARLRERFGGALRAVLFYGSCLRHHEDQESLLDLYALVDDYRSVYQRRRLVWLNRLLPPNVFYLEAGSAGRTVRSKYAVLALRDLGRLTSAATFEPYFWARFAQPCALVYAADDETRRMVVAALATAIVTFVRRGVPLVAPRFESRTLWLTTWRATYRAELRSERPGAVEMLFASAPDRYERVTRLAVTALPYPVTCVATADGGAVFEAPLSAAACRRARTVWSLRVAHAKLRFLLRLLRNGLIFEGGVDYVLWKIQRHSGVEIDRTWRQKRHPLLALGAEAWRLYRAGGFR